MYFCATKYFVMKEKIKTALKTKYKNLGFGEKAFNGMTDYLANNVKGEGDIETAISGVENLLKAFQGEVDTVRQEKSLLQNKLAELEGLKNKQEHGNESNLSGAPNWFLDFKKANDQLIAGIAEQNKKLLEEQGKEKRQQLIAKYVKEMEIPEGRMIGVKIDDHLKEDEIKQLLSEIKQSTINLEVPTKKTGIQVTNDAMLAQEEKDFVASLPNKS